MESSLHRSLKLHYAGGEQGRVEVPIGADRVDAIDPEGTIVEVQCGSTAKLRPKLGRLLTGARVRVVLPVILSRRIIRCVRSEDADRPGRFSPKRGQLFDAFEHLIGLAPLFSHPNLEVLIAAVEIDELRRPIRKGRSFKVLDRQLLRIATELPLREAGDLWALLPEGLPNPFSTRELAACSNRPDWIARRAAYCLRLSGAVVEVGRLGRCRGYQFPAAIEARAERGDPGWRRISSSIEARFSASSARMPGLDVPTRS